MIDRFGREVQPLSVFTGSTNANLRPFAHRTAFGRPVKPQMSLLPPPVAWRPRPVSQSTGAPWDGKVSLQSNLHSAAAAHPANTFHRALAS